MARDKSGSAAKYHIEVDERRGTGHALSLDFTGRDRKVLELGCASGHVSTALKARGHHVTGVEIDPESAERARAIADRVVTADLDRDALPDLIADRDFDVVLMGDVLEHLRDPLTVLQEAASMLQPDGFAVVSLPNVAFVDVRMALLDGDWTYRGDGLLDDTHLRFFTRRSVFELAEKAGLVITELRRVLKDAGASNVALADPVIGTAVREFLLQDPNATTYVFIAKMERPNDANVSVARELAASLEHDEAAAYARLRELVSPQARELEALQQSREELVALKNTKLFRSAALPRRVYGKIRRTLHRP
jgi:2-polyprenyl-3-methyl-5-hydroxy-6-metoxy-1,4-benzoquinol methylase